MIASIKLELWYMNTPEMTALCDDEGVLTARGAMLSLLEYLRLSHNAVGHRCMLKKVARDCGCSADWLWHIVTDYGLFEYASDETFFSPYLMKTLGLGRKQSASRERTRYKDARYNEDNDYNEDNNHKKEKVGVRVSDDTPPTDGPAPATDQTDNASTDKPDGASTSEAVGPSAYETVDREGVRHGKHGETVPWWAPPQTDVYAVWSMVAGRWLPRSDTDAEAERRRRQEMAPRDFMMKTAWEQLSEKEHHRIQDYARRT